MSLTDQSFKKRQKCCIMILNVRKVFSVAWSRACIEEQSKAKCIYMLHAHSTRSYLRIQRINSYVCLISSGNASQRWIDRINVQIQARAVCGYQWGCLWRQAGLMINYMLKGSDITADNYLHTQDEAINSGISLDSHAEVFGTFRAKIGLLQFYILVTFLACKLLAFLYCDVSVFFYFLFFKRTLVAVILSVSRD